ncbi:carboxylesterase type B [Thozetella sp. PMI_491]|nr:carboxylesterase type B [Thozetella sp. PMI_491]
MLLFTWLLWLTAGATVIQQRAETPAAPTATVKNGTYVGVHNDFYNVDYFLGIPFAQPATGNLRLALPASLNSSFAGVRSGTQLGPGCIGFSAAEINRPISEDCLSINIYRPSGYENQSLPVLIWIYGGGFIQGLNADPRYNLTFFVKNSVSAGKPIVAASINYRLNGFGFLDSEAIRKAGVANLGLQDQRLALHWVQENIHAFGGDRSKVTIWGQSAGAMSAGQQLLAYGGRDDGLFRAAIADSGGPLSGQPPTESQSLATWNSILNLTGCTGAVDALACLRSVSTANYTNAVNQTNGRYAPVYDGVFLQAPNTVQIKAGQFVKVPLLIGSNVDEGTGFVGSPPSVGALPKVSYPNTTSFLDVARGYVRNTTMVDAALAALSVLYPDIPAIGTPHSHRGRLNDTFGAQYARVASLAGDMTIHRGRRVSSQYWAKYGVPVYSYNFAAWPIGGFPDFVGTTHFSEIQAVFDNEGGNGYVAPWYPAGSEFAGVGPELVALARLMSTPPSGYYGLWLSDRISRIFAHPC